MFRTTVAGFAALLAASLTSGPAHALARNDVVMVISAQERFDDFFTPVAFYAAEAADVIQPVTTGYQFGDLTRTTVYGHVLPGLTTFQGLAISPFPADNPQQGSQVKIDVRRSFVKVAEDASMKYTYTAGQLELLSLDPPARRCQQSHCIYAEVSAFAAVRDSQSRDLWFEEKTASIYLDNGEFKTTIGSNGSGGGLRNGDWAWTAELGAVEGTFTLDGPFSANFDLSGIDTGEVFTLEYTMILRAVDLSVGGARSKATAFAVDPVTGEVGDGYGFALVQSGLAPVPEPASWMLISAGLLAISGAVRRGRRRQVLPRLSASVPWGWASPRPKGQASCRLPSRGPKIWTSSLVHGRSEEASCVFSKIQEVQFSRFDQRDFRDLNSV